MCFWTNFHISISQALPAGKVFVSTMPQCRRWIASPAPHDGTSSLPCGVLRLRTCARRSSHEHGHWHHLHLWSASSAGAVSHSWLREAPGRLDTVYSFLRLHEETWGEQSLEIRLSHRVICLHGTCLVCVCKTERTFFLFSSALVLPSGCGEMERWDALITANETVFCISGCLGNSLGDITPCLCRLIVCHGKAIHPYTTSFLPRLPEINFPFCLFPIETDPKHVCVATHTYTSPSLHHAGGCGRREREDIEVWIKSPCFLQTWILLCPSSKTPLPLKFWVTQGFFCPEANSGTCRPTSACQVRWATSCRYSTSGWWRKRSVLQTNTASPPWQARGIR